MNSNFYNFIEGFHESRVIIQEYIKKVKNGYMIKEKPRQVEEFAEDNNEY